MHIERWVNRLGPRMAADYLTVSVRQGQPAVWFGWRFSILPPLVIPVELGYAAQLLHGNIQRCAFTGAVAASAKGEYSYFSYYDNIQRGPAILVTCKRCGYQRLDRGKFQAEPHPSRDYLVGGHKSAHITEGELYKPGMYFGLRAPMGEFDAYRLVVARAEMPPFNPRPPKWVYRTFPDGQVVNLLGYSYVVLEVPPS